MQLPPNYPPFTFDISTDREELVRQYNKAYRVCQSVSHDFVEAYENYRLSFPDASGNHPERDEFLQIEDIFHQATIKSYELVSVRCALHQRGMGFA